jgi:hypothetical protein
MIVSYGFYSSKTIELSPLSDIQSLDLTTSTFYPVHTGASGHQDNTDYTRGGHTSVTHNNHLYAVGGLVYANNRWGNEPSPKVSKVSLKENPADYTDADNPTVYSTIALPSSFKPRGEVSSGRWTHNGRNFFVLHGGLSISGTTLSALSDTHLFDLDTEELVSLDVANSDPPTPRFSHVSVVMDDYLIIHGGRTISKGDSSWYMLSSVSCLNLVTQKWTDLTPPNGGEVPRSYHSMVAWGSRIWEYGGYRTVTSQGRQVAYVFSDLFTTKFTPPVVDDDEEEEEDASNSVKPAISNWMKYDSNNSTSEIDVRFQHTSIVYNSILITFGGRFQDTEDVDGIYGIDLSEVDINSLVLASDDDLESDYVSLKTLHFIIAIMLLIVLVFLGLFGLMRRRVMADGLNGDVLRRGPNAGLDQEFINDIPIIPYVPRSDGTPSASAVIDAPDGGGDVEADGDNVESDCCPICLCEYEEGENVRALPCKHVFHPDCVDTWLKRNATCPACRQSIRLMIEAQRREGERTSSGSGSGRTGRLAGMFRSERAPPPSAPPSESEREREIAVAHLPLRAPSQDEPASEVEMAVIVRRPSGSYENEANI